MKIKVRQLPNAVIPAGRSDYFVLAQTAGGQVTRKITMSQVASTLFTSGSYISISNGVISANAAGINALIRPEIVAVASRVSTLESSMRAVQAAVANQPTQQSHVYYDGSVVSSGGQSQGSASAAVINLAKKIYSDLAAGTIVYVKWRRFWQRGHGNGTSSYEQRFVGVYRVNSSTSWTLLRNYSLG